MRRQNDVEAWNNNNTHSKANVIVGSGSKLKKTGNWLKCIRTVAGSVTGPKEWRSGDQRDTSSEKGGRRSSSAADDSQDASFHGPEKVWVRQYEKSCKKLTLFTNPEKKRRGMSSTRGKSDSLNRIVVPETVFALSDKPICSFQGHSDDVLDLSWSKSQLLLSSSMDKTVRLWHLPNNTCLKNFSHSDYVTCIHFNPVDDRYFISGSLDVKVRVWRIPDRHVVDWNDLHEMVTAACYTPDGQGALVGSYKGSCHLYNFSDT